MTPVTPVTADAATSLQRLIEQDADSLNETSRMVLKRHLEKLTNALDISFAEQALLRDKAEFLTKINNEAKVRRATNAEILGKAKVMSYKDLEKARAERAAKEQAKAKGKGKRGRKPKNAVADAEAIGVIGNRGQKRKIAAPEADTSEPKAKVVRMSEGLLPKETSVNQMSEAQVVEYEIMQF